MKIETQPLENRQVNVTAEFDADTLEDYKRRAARKISRDVRIPGFRPGKAPIEMVRRMYGEETIQQRAIEMLVDEMYPKVLDEAELKPSGPGSLEDILSTDPLKISFVIPLEPEITLGDYQSLRLPYEPKAVTDDDVDEFLRRMRTNYATAEPVERAAEKGDLVYVKFSGQLVSPAEGEDADVFPERPAQFIIGDENVEDRDWPFENFADLLIGMNAGDSKTIPHTFGEEDPDEKLRGKEVAFQVTVESIKDLQLPELDDEFAKTLGNFETLDDVRKAIREQMEQSSKQEYDQDYYNKVIDQMIEQSTISFPPHMLEHEQEHVLEHLKEDLGRQGMDFESYLKFLNKDQAAFIDEEVRPAAEKRLQRSLLLDEIAKHEKVELSQTDMDEAIQGTMAQLQNMPRQGKKDRVPENVINSMTYSALSRVYNQRILDRLKSIATGEAEKAAAEETVEPAAEEAKPAKTAKAAPKKPRKKKEPAVEQAPESQPASEETKEE